MMLSGRRRRRWLVVTNCGERIASKVMALARVTASIHHSHRIRSSHPPPAVSALRTPTVPAMINAVLVFNNNGQPRLTKFYTQLVSPPPLTMDGLS